MNWQPTRADYDAALRDQNPWHTLGIVPAELSPPTLRPLAEVLWQALLDPALRRHQLILGPRRVGKTTVMYQTVSQLLEQKVAPKRLWWLRLDHPLLLTWPLDDLVRQIIRTAQATAERPAFLFLDELNYAHQWDLWLKTFYDERWPVRVVGTSSATAAIRQRGTESGVGRWDEQFLAPCLLTEYLELKGTPSPITARATLSETLQQLADDAFDYLPLLESRRHYLLTGGFPELLLESRRADEASELLRSQRVLRQDAIEKALYKDLPQAFSIQDPQKLERLLYVLAGQIAGVLSPSSVGTDLGLTAPTVDRYVDFLERAFIVFTLQNYSASEGTVQRRGKKIYFVDGAVRNAALLRGIAPANDRAEMGLLIENMAASHLRSLAYQANVRAYHWRSKGAEVDLVYDHPNDPLAFEITAGTSHTRSGLNAFAEAHAQFRGKCYVVGEGVAVRRPTLTEAGSLPIDAFLLAIGAQERRALRSRLSNESGESGDPQLLLFR